MRSGKDLGEIDVVATVPGATGLARNGDVDLADADDGTVPRPGSTSGCGTVACGGQNPIRLGR